MVLGATYDSSSTLMSVNAGSPKTVTSRRVLSSEVPTKLKSTTTTPAPSRKRRLLPGLRSTHIQVPLDNNTATEPLHLPLNELFSIEDVVQSYPGLMEQHDALLEADVVQYGKETKGKVEQYVYIHQGELGHALAKNCDVLLSDRATTCHILAFRSRSGRAAALSTLTHLDGTNYTKCIKAAIEFHRQHHEDDEAIQIDVHVAGGFSDGKETSAKITKWLFHLLADLAAKYKDTITFTLRTACVTALNDRNGTPRVRGLSIHCGTGHIRLAKAICLGPLPPLRAARIWANSRTLHTVHSTDGRLRIPKFAWKAVPDYLLKLPDATLKQQCSTSPDAEEDDFCVHLRQTFTFLQVMTPSQVFGDRSGLEFARCRQNLWVPV